MNNEDYERPGRSDPPSFGKIKAAFEKTCSHVRFDARLAKRVSDFKIGFANKNEDHMEFFGGNLLGVQIVRFTPHDRDKFFVDVVEIDESEVEDAIHAVPVVHPDRVVSSDTFNQVGIWMIHNFYVSALPEKMKLRAMEDVAVIMCYRFITSLFYSRFRYPADKEVAQATYDSLSNKFAIKQYGTWQGVLDARASDMVSIKGIHAKVVEHYDDDLAIINMINDAQGRIRSMVNNVYSEFMKVRERGVRVKSTSLVADFDGEQIFKDKTRTLASYIQYSMSIASDEHAYIKQDILDVLEKAVHTAPPQLVRQVLQWCCMNQKHTGNKDFEKLIERTLVHSFEYLSNNRTTFRDTNNLSLLVSTLKGVYTSSRGSEPALVELRELAVKIVKKSATTRNANLIASIRTALLLYIVIRAFTMNHYSGS